METLYEAYLRGGDSDLSGGAIRGGSAAAALRGGDWRDSVRGAKEYASNNKMTLIYILFVLVFLSLILSIAALGKKDHGTTVSLAAPPASLATAGGTHTTTITMDKYAGKTVHVTPRILPTDSTVTALHVLEVQSLLTERQFGKLGEMTVEFDVPAVGVPVEIHYRRMGETESFALPADGSSVILHHRSIADKFADYKATTSGWESRFSGIPTEDAPPA